ncbi:MAG: HD domain-containing protein [Clostridia bacterium]|nr:HD domain-containing protein [Clostridia bacterium]
MTRIVKTFLAASVIITALALSLCTAYLANAASDGSFGAYVYTQYNEDSGLLTGESNTVIQTSDGYLWIGSYGGLMRYDGTNFVSINPYIDSAAVSILFESKDKTLYIGTNEKGVIAYKDDVFTPISYPDSEIIAGYKKIRDFVEDSKGNVYVLSTAGLGRIKDNTFEAMEFTEVPGERFSYATVDEKDNIWMISSEGQIVVVNGNSIIATYDSSDFGIVRAMGALAIGSSIYIGSVENKVACVSLRSSYGRNNTSQYDISYIDLGEVSNVNNIARSSLSGSPLISCKNGYGYISGGRFYRVDEHSRVDISANGSTQDYEGNYWIASTTLGLVRYSKGFFETSNYETALADEYINAVYKRNGMYFVAYDSGIFIYDESWRVVNDSKVSALKALLEGKKIRNVTGDTLGNVWFAAYDVGAVRFNPVSGEYTVFGSTYGIPSVLRVVYPLSDGRMFVGHETGFVIIRGDSVDSSAQIQKNGVPSSVLCAVETGGVIYIGSNEYGVFEYKNGQLRSYDENNGLLDTSILRLVADEDNPGNFFVCGLHLHYFENGTFRVLDNFDKDAGSIFNAVDYNGSIWLFQNNGISSLNKRKLLSGEPVNKSSFGLTGGLTGTLNANTWHYMENGVIYIATRNGISMFNFSGVDIPVPKVIVNSVYLDDVEIVHPKSLKMGSGVQRITIDASMLLYSDLADYKISYQLIGFDAEPINESGKHISASYTNLSGGDYTFKVIVSDPFTGEIKLESTIIIEKELKFIETVWFWILVGVLSAGVMALGFYIFSTAKIRKARRHEKEFQDITEQALETVARTIDAKDNYTKGHSNRVAIYSREIARRMGYSEQDQRKVYYIALLHDIGKIGVPDNILNKPGRLTPEEREVIQQHPAIGGEILQDFIAVPGIADGARYHHEKYDGTGYVSHVSGKNIPEIARIIGIADSYDAMQSARCYRPALTDEYIRNELVNCAGKQFDPDIVKYMLDMIDDGTAPQTDQDQK